MSGTINSQKAALHEKKCLRCNSLFKPTSPNQKYCGSENKKIGCSYEMRKIRNRINDKRRKKRYLNGTSIEWRKKYPEKYRKQRNEYIKRYRKTPNYKNYRKKQYERRMKFDKKFRFNEVMKKAIYKALQEKKAGRKWEKLVGYSLQDLMSRLEFNFDKKMNWDNYGSYWSIDHKKPKSLFKYDNPEDQAFKDCWCLANLQPMEAMENIKKSNKF